MSKEFLSIDFTYTRYNPETDTTEVISLTKDSILPTQPGNFTLYLQDIISTSVDSIPYDVSFNVNFVRQEIKQNLEADNLTELLYSYLKECWLSGKVPEDVYFRELTSRMQMRYFKKI